MRRGGFDAVYFVDDNFIANPRAARELLPHLIRWQKANDYPVRFACEATLNMAQMPDLLALLREAGFYAVFVGIETPEPAALDAIRKQQNLRLPILDAIATFNSFGLEVVSGIIMGLDTDGPETGSAIRSFIDVSQIPLLTINLLYALPKTPLHDRLAREGRSAERRRSGRQGVERAFPHGLRRRRRHVVRNHHRRLPARQAARPLPSPDRHDLPTAAAQSRASRAGRSSGAASACWRACSGIAARGAAGAVNSGAWRCRCCARGRIEEMVSIATVAHHLITFVGEIRSGKHEACFYADPSRSTMDARRSLARVRRDAAPLQAAE